MAYQSYLDLRGKIQPLVFSGHPMPPMLRLYRHPYPARVEADYREQYADALPQLTLSGYASRADDASHSVVELDVKLLSGQHEEEIVKGLLRLEGIRHARWV